jgi:hypothetical protein
VFFVGNLIKAVLVYLLAHALTTAFGLPFFFGHWAWWLCVFLLVTIAYVERVRDELATQSRNPLWLTPALRPLVFGGFFGFLGRFNGLLTISILIAAWIFFNWIAMLAAFGANVFLALATSRMAARHAKQILIEPQVVGNEELQRFLETGRGSQRQPTIRVQADEGKTHGDAEKLPKVVEYQTGQWSLVELDDGTLIMVSIGKTSVWIYVRRRWLIVYRRWLPGLPFLLRKYPRLGAKRTLLWVVSLRKADGNLAPLRREDGTPLELGRTLLEVVTECLRDYAESLGGRGSSSFASLKPLTLDDWGELSFDPQFDEHGLTPFSQRDLQARLAFRKEIVRLHPGATPQELFEASTFFGVYNPALASGSFREVIQNLSASDPFWQELEMHLKGPLPSWLCFPPSFWKELESLQLAERDKRFKGRMRELGIDLGEVSDRWQ